MSSHQVDVVEKVNFFANWLRRTYSIFTHHASHTQLDARSDGEHKIVFLFEDVRRGYRTRGMPGRHLTFRLTGKAHTRGELFHFLLQLRGLGMQLAGPFEVGMPSNRQAFLASMWGGHIAPLPQLSGAARMLLEEFIDDRADCWRLWEMRVTAHSQNELMLLQEDLLDLRDARIPCLRGEEFAAGQMANLLVYQKIYAALHQIELRSQEVFALACIPSDCASIVGAYIGQVPAPAWADASYADCIRARVRSRRPSDAPFPAGTDPLPSLRNPAIYQGWDEFGKGGEEFWALPW